MFQSHSLRFLIYLNFNYITLHKMPYVIFSSIESVGVIESFDKALYNGEVNDGTVNHETITVTGYNGSDVQLFGGKIF